MISAFLYNIGNLYAGYKTAKKTHKFRENKNMFKNTMYTYNKFKQNIIIINL